MKYKTFKWIFRFWTIVTFGTALTFVSQLFSLLRISVYWNVLAFFVLAVIWYKIEEFLLAQYSKNN